MTRTMIAEDPRLTDYEEIFAEGAARRADEVADIDTWRGGLPRYGWVSPPTMHTRSIRELLTSPDHPERDLEHARQARGDSPRRRRGRHVHEDGPAGRHPDQC